MLIFKYSIKILFRNIRSFILPFLSLFITSLIVMIVLLFTSSSRDYLSIKNKELVGGDVVFSSKNVVDKNVLENSILNQNQIINEVDKISFQGSLISSSSTFTASISVIEGDDYPLYGNFILESGINNKIKDDQIVIDKSIRDKYNINISDIVNFGDARYVVSDVIISDPTKILEGFNLLPKVIINNLSFEKSNIPLELLRPSYEYQYKTNTLSQEFKNEIKQKSKNLDLRVRFSDTEGSSLLRGFKNVEQFLIISVLITCILATANIYVGIMYLIQKLKKSLAILLALGMKKKDLIMTTWLSLAYTVILSAMLGCVSGIILFRLISNYISNTVNINLNLVSLPSSIFIVLLITLATFMTSFVPAILSLFNISPKSLITENVNNKSNNSKMSLAYITIFTLLPLVLIFSYILNNVLYALLTFAGVCIIYILIATLFYILINILYKLRNKYSFLFRTIIAEKKSDGIFGVISTASLYIALTSLCVFVLIQASLSSFLSNDLNKTLPSAYILDVQNSQYNIINENYNDTILFPNIRARIISIDNKKIQDLIESNDVSIDRELGREFNLTYRDSLLDSEQIKNGNWLSGEAGEVSVDAEFAKRADIRLGSEITFRIQGFDVAARVNSLRETDSRSGLPFFYFILSPKDLSKFPATYFGYNFYKDDKLKTFSNFIATQMPNVSIVDTKEIGVLADQIVDFLLLIIVIISLPPLILSLFLVVTLLLSSFSFRKKVATQLLALGSRASFVRKLYIYESVSGVLITSILAYVSGCIITYLLIKYYILIDKTVLFVPELFYGIISISLLVIIVVSFLLYFDKRPLKAILAHEEH